MRTHEDSRRMAEQANSTDCTATVVVDALTPATLVAERLEIEISLHADTTVGAIVDDVGAALEEMHLELLSEPQSTMLAWCEDDEYRKQLPSLDGCGSVKDTTAFAAALRVAYRNLCVTILEDAAVPVFSYLHDRHTLLLNTPPIKEYFSRETRQGKGPAQLLLMPGLPTLPSGAASVPGPPLSSAPRLSPEAVPSPNQSQEQWIAHHLLRRPSSSFKNYLGSDPSLPPLAAGGAIEDVSAKALRARQLVKDATLAQLNAISRAGAFPADGDGGSALRDRWLEQCQQEAAAYEGETQRLEVLIAQRIAWHTAATRSLHDEVSHLKEEANAGSKFSVNAAALRERLSVLHAQAESVQKEEASLLAELRRSRTALRSPASQSRDTPATETPPSPAPRPPVSLHPAWENGGEHGDSQTEASPVKVDMPHEHERTPQPSVSKEGCESAIPDANTRSTSPIQKNRIAEGAPQSTTGRSIFERLREMQNDDTCRAPETLPPTNSFRLGGSAPATQLSFNTNSLPATPRHREDGDEYGNGSYFFPPSLRASVERAIEHRKGEFTSSDKSWSRTPNIRVVGIRQDRDVKNLSGTVDSERGTLSLSERLRIATADVSNRLDRFRAVSPTQSPEDRKTSFRLR